MLVSGLLSRESQPQNCCTIKAVSRSTHRISLGFLIRAVQVVTLTNSKKNINKFKKITTTPTPTTPKPKQKFKFTFQRVSFRPQLPSLLEPRPLPRDESQVFLTAGWYHFCSWITWVLFYIFLYKVSRNSRWSQPLYWLRCYIFTSTFQHEISLNSFSPPRHVPVQPLQPAFWIIHMGWDFVQNETTPWKIHILNPKMEVWKMIFLFNWVIF